MSHESRTFSGIKKSHVTIDDPDSLLYYVIRLTVELRIIWASYLRANFKALASRFYWRIVS